MAKAKAKSDKSCGLDVKCHINKAVAAGKKFIADAGGERHKAIKKVVDDAVDGKE